MMKRVTVRLSADEINRLDSLAKKTGKTRSFHARRGILLWLEKIFKHPADDIELSGNVDSACKEDKGSR